MEAHSHYTVMMSLVSLFTLSLTAAAATAAENIASLQLRNVIDPQSAGQLQRNYLPPGDSFEQYRQLRNGKYMRFGRGSDQPSDQPPSLGEQELSNDYDSTLTANRPANSLTNKTPFENKRAGEIEDIDNFMRYDKRVIGSQHKRFKSFNTMMRFGKRDDAVDLSDSDAGQSSNTYQTTPTTQQQLEVNKDELVKRGRSSSESGSQFMRFGK